MAKRQDKTINQRREDNAMAKKTRQRREDNAMAKTNHQSKKRRQCNG